MSSEQDHRPMPRPLFVDAERQVGRIYFYTSSIEKYLQGRLVFDRHGLTVDYFKSRTDPYDEDYAGTTTDLLTKAISEVTDQVGRGHLVFVEDTSLRIEAMSDPARDWPGMRVKDWFAETSFAELDTSLRSAGDRRATVKSDIALKLPGLERPVLFHGETVGQVATEPPDFAPNPQYPWLTPRTFNGWFIPDGADQPLGSMSLDESLAYDFRARAFEELIDRVEEYAAALNLPPSSYRRRRQLAASEEATPVLFDVAQAGGAPALLVVGRTCAGKTTFAEYGSANHGLTYIEASTIVRSLHVERFDSDDRDGFAFAMRALDRLGHDIVPRTIVERYGDRLQQPFVVSGLRDIEEIRYMTERVPRCRVVLIDASERTRFERHVRRARPGAETTLTEFRARDRRQDAFGLLPIADDVADIRITNEGKMEGYHRQIDAVISGSSESGVDFDVKPRHKRGHHQLYRCLRILEQAGSALQCDEIESRSTESGASRIRRNNANKVLKAIPAFAIRMDPQNGSGQEDSTRVRYAVTPAGVAYMRLLEGRWQA